MSYAYFDGAISSVEPRVLTIIPVSALIVNLCTLYLVMQRIIYWRIKISMQPFPAFVGSDVSFLITFRDRINSKLAGGVRLTCYQYNWNSNRDGSSSLPSERIYPEERREITGNLVSTSASANKYEVKVHIPEDCSPTMCQSRFHSIEWHLSVYMGDGLVPYREKFIVPVFRIDKSDGTRSS